MTALPVRAVRMVSGRSVRRPTLGPLDLPFCEEREGLLTADEALASARVLLHASY